MQYGDNTFERILLGKLCMHIFEQTFSKFHNMFERLIFTQKVLYDQKRLLNPTVKVQSEKPGKIILSQIGQHIEQKENSCLCCQSHWTK